jgi:hypothetical protein
MLLAMVKPSDASRKKLNLSKGWKYHIYLMNNGKIQCDCMGYVVYENCKHIKHFEPVVSRINNERGKRSI